MHAMTAALLKPMPYAPGWNHVRVIERLTDALQTLARMSARGCFPAGARSSMPDPVQRLADWMPQPGSPTFAEDYAHVLERVADERHRNRSVPTAAAISAMEEALGWQWLVSSRKHFQCLAAVCLGAKTMELAKRYNVTQQTIREWRQRALDQIVSGLESGNEGLANLAATR